MASKYGTLYDALKDNGIDTNLSSSQRQRIASDAGIKNYSGSSSQNTAILNQINSGKLNLTNYTASNKHTGNTAASNTSTNNAAAGAAVNKWADADSAKSYIEEALSGIQKPAAYQSAYQGQIDALLGQIMNRGNFEYDMNTDPLYQKYKDQYTLQGNMAMRDTMGNAAALTGGYGNSYATTAGSQAYDQYMTMLSDKSLDLYDRAYNQWQDEGQNMYNQLNALNVAEQNAYNRYLQEYNQYRDTYSDAYDMALQLVGIQTNADNSAEDQRRWDAEYQLSLDQFEWQKQQAAAKKNSGGGSGGSGYETVTYSSLYNDVKAMKSMGYSNAKINNVIDAAYKDGYIRSDEASTLKNSFGTRNSTNYGGYV